MATYVVGDIQGCYEELCRLLDHIKFTPGLDQLWSVGDMVNRGADSLSTLRLLLSLGDDFIGVLGNHDLHFLALASKVAPELSRKKNQKNKSLYTLLNAPDLDKLFQFVRALPYAHRQKLTTENGRKDFLMVHAGIVPGWGFTRAMTLAEELKEALQSHQYRNYLRNMYGNTPNSFSQELQGYDRLRVLTNIFTRIRFISQKSELDFKFKGTIKEVSKGWLPWFQLQRKRESSVILFGHWAMLNGKTGRKDIVGLDTGCVWGRKLTALCLQSGKKYHISAS
jgi:bis(5'-nucleosyl)-tetraphosphatase (symmetrical)